MRVLRRLPAVLLVPYAVYVLSLFLLALLVVGPPLLGWLGFGLAAGIGLLVVTAASTLLRRAGVNVDPAPRARDGIHRVLVLADSRPSPGFIRELRPHLRSPGSVRVVAPLLPTPARFLAESEGEEDDEARERLATTLAALRAAGVEATGELGTDNPLQAIGDVLTDFPADEIVVLTSEESLQTWLERGLRGRARQLFRVPITCIRLDSRRSLRPSAPRPV